VARELGEGIAVHVRGEIGAHHVAGLLAHVLRPALRIEPGHFVEKNLNFFFFE